MVLLSSPSAFSPHFLFTVRSNQRNRTSFTADCGESCRLTAGGATSGTSKRSKNGLQFSSKRLQTETNGPTVYPKTSFQDHEVIWLTTSRAVTVMTVDKCVHQSKGCSLLKKTCFADDSLSYQTRQGLPCHFWCSLFSLTTWKWKNKAQLHFEFNLEMKPQYWTLDRTVAPLICDCRRAFISSPQYRCFFFFFAKNRRDFFGSSRLWLMSSYLTLLTVLCTSTMQILTLTVNVGYTVTDASLQLISPSSSKA